MTGNERCSRTAGSSSNGSAPARVDARGRGGAPRGALAALALALAGGCGGDAKPPVPHDAERPVQSDAGAGGQAPGADAAAAAGAGGQAPGADAAAAAGLDGGTTPRADGGPPAPDARAAAPAADARAAGTKWTCASMEPVMEDLRAGFGRVCVEAIPDRATWESISVPERPGSEIVRVTKFFLPAAPAAGIPPAFLDAHRWSGLVGVGQPGDLLQQPWHLVFATQFLPRKGNPSDSYVGPDRVAWAGYLAEIEVSGIGRVFGYYIEEDRFPCDTHKRIHADMARVVGLRPLYRTVFGPIPSPNKTIAGCDVPALVLR